MEGILDKLGRIIARDRLVEIRTRLKYAGLEWNPERFVAVNALIGAGFSALVALIFYVWTNNLLYALLAFAGAGITYYFFILGIVGLFVDRRAKFVENVLPDALQLMASNIRSGVAPDEALFMSAKSEFGFLSKNIKTAGQKIATGIPVEKALDVISEDIDSDVLDQTIKLIIEGISSGGELASILEGTAKDIKDNDILRKEIRSVIMLYGAFIFLAVAVISPVLYSVSSELAMILSKLGQTLASGFLVEGSTSTIPISTAAQVSADFLMVFSYVNIIMTAVFGSLMIGLINKGNEKYGLRYMPFVLGLAILLFNVGRIVMKYFFGSIAIL